MRRRGRGGGHRRVVATISNRTLATSAGVLLLVYPAWRGYDTFPAVDRSWDNRAVKLLEQFTARPDNVVFGVDSNWQVQNAFEYFMREHRPGIPWFATEELKWLEWPGGRDRFEAFIRANANAERDIIVTPRVHEKIRNPPTSPWQHDLGPAMRFSAEVKSVRQGTPYVFAVLSADREYPLNTTEIGRVWQWLTTEPVLPNLHQYTVFAGTVGERPVLIESRDRPYRVRVRIDALDVDIRMESWLPTDTIRRTGFGHVIVNGRHELTLERGVSFKALGTAGEPIYDSGLFAPIPRILVRPNPQPPIPNP